MNRLNTYLLIALIVLICGLGYIGQTWLTNLNNRLLSIEATTTENQQMIFWTFKAAEQGLRNDGLIRDYLKEGLGLSIPIHPDNATPDPPAIMLPAPIPGTVVT